MTGGSFPGSINTKGWPGRELALCHVVRDQKKKKKKLATSQPPERDLLVPLSELGSASCVV